MKMERVAALGALFLAGCAAVHDVAPPPDARVIRCVLDRHCRALVVPLGGDLWAAWDTDACTLLKVWQGDVAWDGPVYTTVHGPQPTTQGDDLCDPLVGATWRHRTDDSSYPAKEVRFAGYDAPADGPVTLHWRLSFGSKEREVDERVERIEPDARGRARLRRTFTLTPSPAMGIANAIYLQAWNRPPRALDNEVVTDGYFSGKVWTPELIATRKSGAQPLGADDFEAPPGETTAAAGLTMRVDGPTVVTVAYSPPPPAEAAPSPAAAEPEATPSEPPPAVSPADRRAALLTPPRDLANPAPTEPGVRLRIFALDNWIQKLAPLESGQTPNVEVVLRTLDLDGERGDFTALGGPDDMFLAQATTSLRVDEPGEYVFRLTSDDGSRLTVNGGRLIDNDGLHSESGKEGGMVLPAGEYELDVWMFEAGGGEVLRLEWKPPGAQDFTVLPTERLSTPAGVVRVTSPGPKRTLKPLPRSRPGDGAWLAGVHPSFELHSARPPDFEPKVGGLAMRPDGTLLVSTWDRDGAVWALTGACGDDPSKIRRTRIASGLAEPLGLWTDGRRTFVLQKQELTELIDHDGDGVTDEYRCACNGWNVTPNFHEFAFGLAERDGWFYATLAVAIDPGGRSSQRQGEGRGSVIRIHPDDGRFEVVAQGLRTPNGIGYGADLGWHDGDPLGQRPLYVADNQGDWLPSSKVVLVQPGAFYGNRSVLRERADGITDTPPVVWLPQGDIGNSPSQPVPLAFGPWRGQMLVGDVTYGGLQRIAVDRIGTAPPNACVFAFSQGLEAGVNRLCWALDGARADGVGADLFAGGIGSTGNWGQEGKRKFGLERLRYTGAPCFEMLDVQNRPVGLRVSFTEPLAPGAGLDPDGWFVESWRYVPTDSYGGPKVDQQEHPVKAVALADDRRSLRLDVPGLLPGTIVHLRALDELRSDGGRALWTHEAWLTLNVMVPGNDMMPTAETPAGALTEAQRAAGWRALFDGTSLAGWHDHAAPAAGGAWPAVQGWAAQDGALVRTGNGGDLVSNEIFQDFELTLDWRIAAGGNSGIFFGVDETPRADGSLPYVWESGIEMQVLDDAGHADGSSPLTSAGACYALYAPTHDDTRPLGHWNHVRILKQGAHVEHWLNGRLQCAYDIGSADWNARVAASKFASMPAFGKATRGRLALQDHGDDVAFRNVFVRLLDR